MSNMKEKNMRFDAVLSFDVEHDEGIEILTKEVQEAYPDYTIEIIGDLDLTDL